MFSTTHRRLQIAIYVLAALWAVRVVVEGLWWAKVLSGVVLLSGAVGLLMQLWRPPATLVSADGVRVRRVLVPGRLVPWSAVERIEVQGRFEGNSVLVTRDGRRVPLPGLPREEAEQLARP